MGVFERIRTMSPYFLATFAVLFILFMVISDMDTSTLMNQSGNPENQAIAEVNGDKITYFEFEQLVRQQLERQRAQQQEAGEETEIDESSIRAQIYQDLVDLKLSEQIFNKMGLSDGNAVIADQLINNPPQSMRRMFADSTGQFNRQMYLDVVTNPEKLGQYMGQADPNRKAQFITDFRKDLITMGEQIRLQLVSTFANTTLNNAGSIVSPTYIKEKYRGENSNAEVNYIQLDVNTVANDKIKVTEEDLKEYYNNHKEYFKQDAGAKLKYVIFPLTPSRNDSINAEKKIQKINLELNSAQDSAEKVTKFVQLVNEMNGDEVDFTLIKDLDPQVSMYLAGAIPGKVIGPFLMNGQTNYMMVTNSREGANVAIKASHILIATGDNPEESKAKAESVLARARAGEDFSELAAEYSDDQGTAQNGGDLGWFGKGTMVPAFETAAFDAEVGKATDVVETQFGYHIILVNEKSSKEIKYSTIAISPKLTGATKNTIKRDALSFYTQVKDGENIDSLAAKLNIRVTETAFFKKDQTILGNNWANHFAFSNEVGTLSEPQEFDNYGIAVLYVSEKRAKGTIPFEDKKVEIETIVSNRKKLDFLKPIAEDIAKSVKSGEMGDNVKMKYPKAEIKNGNIKNNGILTGVSGREYAVTNTAFSLSNGSVSNAIRGNKGYYIVQLINKSIPSDDDVNKAFADYYVQQVQNSERQIYYQWFKVIKENSEIVDHRAKYYRSY